MQLETQRLILRAWHPIEDARHAMDIFGDSRVMTWIEGDSQDTSIRYVQGRLQRYRDLTNDPKDKTYSWAIVQKDIGRVIGHMILTGLPDLKKVRSESTGNDIEIVDPEGMSTDYIEIGWHFRPASWGYGYATEAAYCIAQYAFDTLALSILLSVSNPHNLRSVGVMKRLGMRYDGITTRYYRGTEMVLYKLTPADLFEAQARRASETEFLAALNELEQQS